MILKIWAFVTRMTSNLWNNHLKTIRFLGLLATVGGIMPIGEWAVNAWKEAFGSNEENLVTIHSRLIPWFPSTNIPAEKDQVFLQFQLRNYGEQPIFLTSASIDIQNSKAAKIGTAGTQGPCSLSDQPNNNKPIELGSGQEKWITVSPALKLPNISNWFTPAQLSQIHVLTPESPYTIVENFYVESINQKLEELFGPDAKIQVVLYTGVKKRVRELFFDLSKGKDIFAHDGSLMHDSFIATWKEWNSKSLLSDNKDCRTL